MYEYEEYDYFVYFDYVLYSQFLLIATLIN